MLDFDTTAVKLAFLLAQVSDAAILLELAKLLIPALLAYFASRLQARKEQRLSEDSMEERTRQQLAEQQSGIIAEYRTMTAQARDVVSKAYQEAADATIARKAAEGRVLTLESELSELRSRYSEALRELEELRKAGGAIHRTRRDPPR